MESTTHLIQEIFRLNELISSKDKSLQAKDEAIQLKDEALRLKDEELKRKNERILELERQFFGRRSEKRLPDYQNAGPTLFDAEWGAEALEQEVPGVTTIVQDITKKAEERHHAKKKIASSRKMNYRLPANLERCETIENPVDYDPETMIKIGEDVEERLEQEPPRFWVRRTVRPIYKIKEEKDAINTKIVQAPKEQNILPGCMAGSSFLSQIIVDKFCHHLPEYRQSERLKSFGVKISTSNINRWVHQLADKLRKLYLEQMKAVLSTDYIQVDETTISIQDRPGKTRKGYVWSVRSVKRSGIFFYYDEGSRSQEVILKLLKDYQGALQTDGYAAYSIYENKKGVLPLGCLAHVRRKFEHAQNFNPAAKTALDYIATLYMLESNLQSENAGREQIREERENKAYPILQQMEQWMYMQYKSCLPKDPLGKAIKYAFGMWPRICRYCKDGAFRIDNNDIENAIRPIALGRKNWLFSGNNKGAEDSSVFYTLIGSCRQAGIDPLLWFTQTLPKIKPGLSSQELAELLPSNAVIKNESF